MSAWLAILELSIVIAAAVGMVLLRRHADRKWAEHLARQRVMASPAYQEIAANFIKVQIAFRDAFMPAMQQAAAAMAEMAPKLERLYRSLPWRQRVLLRVRSWFA